MSKSREELFEEFVVLGHQTRGLGGIVQNSGVVIEQQELKEWNDQVYQLITYLKNLQVDVIKFYKY